MTLDRSKLPPAMKLAFKALPSSSRQAIRELRFAEKHYADGKTPYTIALLNAAIALNSFDPETSALHAGKGLYKASPREIGQIVRAASLAILEKIRLESDVPDEPSKGGRPKNAWWTTEREDHLVSAYWDRKNRGSKSVYKEAIADWRVLHPESASELPDNEAVRQKLKALLAPPAELDIDALDGFDEEP